MHHCSFNIAISLMGYNEGVLIDELHPTLPFKKGYVDYIEKWKQSITQVCGWQIVAFGTHAL